MVAVGFPHQVRPGQSAQDSVDIVGVFRLDHLAIIARRGDPARREIDGPRHPAAPPFAFVHSVKIEVDVVDIAAEFLPIEVSSQRHGAIEERQVADDGIVAVWAASACPGSGYGAAQFTVLEVGAAGENVDDAADGAGAVEGALGPSQNLDPVNVDQLEVRIGRAVGDRRLIQIEGHGRLGQAGEGAVGHPAKQDLVTARTQVGHGHPGRQGGHGAEIVGAGEVELAAGYGCNGGGHALGEVAAARRGHDNVGQSGRGFGERRRGRRRPCNRRRSGAGAGRPAYEDGSIRAHGVGAAGAGEDASQRRLDGQGSGNGGTHAVTGADVAAQ